MITAGYRAIPADQQHGLIETRGKQEITVAITYGAQHMRAVINHLYGRSFRVIESDWITVTSWV